MTIHQFKRTCSECGEPFQSTMAHADFCGAPCRKAWNNRRAVRGAEIYDLFMCIRHERGVARAVKAWNLICRLASMYRDEDHRERAGRKSWRSARDVLARRPYLRATVSNISIKRRAA